MCVRIFKTDLAVSGMFAECIWSRALQLRDSSKFDGICRNKRVTRRVRMLKQLRIRDMCISMLELSDSLFMTARRQPNPKRPIGDAGCRSCQRLMLRSCTKVRYSLGFADFGVCRLYHCSSSLLALDQTCHCNLVGISSISSLHFKSSHLFLTVRCIVRVYWRR